MATHLFKRHEVAEEKEVGKAVERGRRLALGKFAAVLGALAFVLFLIPITSPPAAHATFPGTNGKMYWANVTTNKIQRANLNGTVVEDLVTGLQSPYGIALDLAGDRMYWTNTAGVVRFSGQT